MTSSDAFSLSHLSIAPELASKKSLTFCNSSRLLVVVAFDVVIVVVSFSIISQLTKAVDEPFKLAIISTTPKLIDGFYRHNNYQSIKVNYFMNPIETLSTSATLLCTLLEIFHNFFLFFFPLLLVLFWCCACCHLKQPRTKRQTFKIHLHLIFIFLCVCFVVYFSLFLFNWKCIFAWQKRACVWFD